MDPKLRLSLFLSILSSSGWNSRMSCRHFTQEATVITTAGSFVQTWSQWWDNLTHLPLPELLSEPLSEQQASRLKRIWSRFHAAPLLMQCRRIQSHLKSSFKLSSQCALSCQQVFKVLLIKWPWRVWKKANTSFSRADLSLTVTTTYIRLHNHLGMWVCTTSSPPF